MNKTIAFTSIAFAEYNEWFGKDMQMIERIKTIIRDIDRNGLENLSL